MEQPLAHGHAVWVRPTTLAGWLAAQVPTERSESADITSLAREVGIPCASARADSDAVAQTGTRVVVTRSRWLPWRKKTTYEPIVENYAQRNLTLLVFVRSDRFVQVPVVRPLIGDLGMRRVLEFIAPQVNRKFLEER